MPAFIPRPQKISFFGPYSSPISLASCLSAELFNHAALTVCE